MGKKLYIEAGAGISGDMTVAMLLDLGADPEVLESVLKTVPADGFEIKISRVKKAGLDCCDFDVILEEDNHDHDMEYLYGHMHDHEHHHDHDHEHHHHHHGHHHVHRGLPEIQEIINGTQMSDRAKTIANRIFEVIAEAEAEAHGIPLTDVHFHEVGAVDSIVDVISIAVCLDNLDITDVIVPYLTEGTGTVRCQHGIIPVPVPAVVNIVKNHAIGLKLSGAMGEHVTPTGAAVVAAIRTSDTLPEVVTIEKAGLGAGKRDYEQPGILRGFIIR